MRISIRGHHDGGETEEVPSDDPKLPHPMAGVTGDLLPPPPPPPVAMLEVVLTWPRIGGYAGPAWPRFCNLNVVVGGELVGEKMLPFELDVVDVEEDVSEREIRKRVRSRAMEDIKRWGLALKIPVRLDWPRGSLDILVERADYEVLWRRNLVVTREGPHTSGHTAVIGRARVQLLDALVHVDDDGEEKEAAGGKNKRPRNKVEERDKKLLEGTVEFGKTVQLIARELPGLWDADGSPRCVVRGTVDVRMCLRRLA